jgi:hypothetical protein
LLFENDIDARQQAVADRADGDAVVFGLAAFACIEGAEVRIMQAGG